MSMIAIVNGLIFTVCFYLGYKFVCMIMNFRQLMKCKKCGMKHGKGLIISLYEKSYDVENYEKQKDLIINYSCGHCGHVASVDYKLRPTKKEVE